MQLLSTALCPFCVFAQVSAVTDQPVQASAATSADLDDDDGGGGLVCLFYIVFFSFSIIYFILYIFCFIIVEMFKHF